MKLSKQTIIIALILSVVLFFVGMYTWNSLFMLILPIVGNIKYVNSSLNGPFLISMLFSLTLALIPFATIIIWRFAPVFKTQRKILTVCIIFLSIIVSVLVRREMIKSKARNLQPTTVLDYSDPANPISKSIYMDIPISSLKFEYYALVGLIAGSIIAYLLLKEKSQVLSPNSNPRN